MIREASICDGTIQMNGGSIVTVDVGASICSGTAQFRANTLDKSRSITRVSDKDAAGFGVVATLASLNSKKNVTASGGNTHIKYVVVGVSPPKPRFASAALVLIALAGIAGAVAFNFDALAERVRRADRAMQKFVDSLMLPGITHPGASYSVPANDPKTTETALNEVAPNLSANRVAIPWNCSNCPSDSDPASQPASKSAPKPPSTKNAAPALSVPSVAAILFRARSAKEGQDPNVELPETMGSKTPSPPAVAQPSPSWAPAHCSNCRND